MLSLHCAESIKRSSASQLQLRNECAFVRERDSEAARRGSDDEQAHLSGPTASMLAIPVSDRLAPFVLQSLAASWHTLRLMIMISCVSNSRRKLSQHAARASFAVLGLRLAIDILQIAKKLKRKI